MDIRFTKMNGAGNDFVVLDNRTGSHKNSVATESQQMQSLQARSRA
jgi:diaminopimelate epimerase